jgi:hypothetical protein
MNIHQWRQHIKKFNEPFEDNDHIQKEWAENAEANISRFNKDNSIWNLEFEYYQEKEKAIVLVGSSPCLKEDIEKLKELDDNFHIICANSALRYLLRNGIKPHYVVCLDSDKIDIPQHLDCDSKDITLLASAIVCPEALDNWKGPIWYMGYSSKYINKNVVRKVKRRLGKTLISGGNSMTTAFFVATAIMQAKTIIFVAHEYCFDKRNAYYADKKAAKQETIKTAVSVTDVKGRQRYTQSALFSYAIWTEKGINDLGSAGFFIDTSFGLLGKDCLNIHNIELSKAIKLVKKAFITKDQLNNSKKTKQEILKEITPHNEQGKVRYYDMHEQREKLLQLARS